MMGDSDDMDFDNTCLVDMKSKFQKYLSSTDQGLNRKRKLDESDMSLVEHNTSMYSKGADDLRQTKIELLSQKSRISSLETQLRRKGNEMEELKILHKREIENITSAHDRELRGYYVLQTSHKRVLQRQEDCEAETKELRERMKQMDKQYNANIMELRQKNIDYDVECTKQLDEEKTKCRELRTQLMNQQMDLAQANGEIIQLKQQLADTSRTLRLDHEMDQWKSTAEMLQQQVDELEASYEQYKNDQVILAARKDDLRRLDKLKEENSDMTAKIRFMRMTGENAEVLKEKISSVEKRLENHNAVKDQNAFLTVETQRLKNTIEELQAKIAPEDTVKMLRECQARELLLTEEMGQVKSANRELESQLSDLKKSRTSLEVKLNGNDGASRRLQQQIERLQRKIILLTKEKEGFKRIVDSYDSDVTRDVIPISRDRETNLQATIDTYSNTVQNLEKVLTEREAEISSLQHKLAQLQADSVTLLTPSKSTAADVADQHMIGQLREQIVQLEKSVEAITQERDVLDLRIESRNMQGDFDPTKTKVLQFSQNPVAQAQKRRAAEIQAVRDENLRLKTRLKVVEKKLEESTDITAQVQFKMNQSTTEDPAKVKELKSKLESLDKRYNKMMEMFKETSQEFRTVVYRLTGYRIDLPESKKYRLMSMYSNSPEEYLIFQECNGDMQLLETDYATTLVSLAEEYLQGEESFPAFLGALTVDLYKQTTMAQNGTLCP